MLRQETALITGASFGLGLEFAKLFAQDGYNLVLTARSGQVLEELAQELHHKYGIQVHVIAKDLSAPNAPKDIVDEIERLGITIDILVNNAGFGVYGPFAKTNVDKELQLLQVNIVALTQLTKLLLPGMIQRRSGKILNVSSTAAFQPGPLMAVYYASKAYVLSFSEAIAYELKGTGVTLSVLCPGPTITNFQTSANMELSKLFTRKGMVLDAKTVATAGYKGLMSGKRLIIPGFLNKLPVFFLRFAPRSIVPAVVRKIQEARS
jgi:uncharacterized protein